MLSVQARMMIRHRTTVSLFDYNLTLTRLPSRLRLRLSYTTTATSQPSFGSRLTTRALSAEKNGFKRTHSTFNGGVVPSLTQGTPRERILWGTLGTSFFGLALYGGYSYRRRLKRQGPEPEPEPEPVVQNPTSTTASPSDPESLLRSLDTEHFSSVDWTDAVQTTLYFRSLVRASLINHSTSRSSTSVTTPLSSPAPATREDARTKRFTEHFLHLVNLLVSLTPESLQNFVRRGRVLQGDDLDAFCKTVEGERRRMHEIMRDTAHRVHERIKGASGSIHGGEMGNEVGRLLSEAYEKLAGIASKDERRIYRVMKALFAVEMIMSSVGQ